MFLSAQHVLPIDGPVLSPGWVEAANGRIVQVGEGRPPAAAEDLGQVALLPGLVNAHTHLELSWMAGHVPPASSMHEWITALLRLRRRGPPGGARTVRQAAVTAARAMRATGTILVGDISNTLDATGAFAAAGLGGVLFHELLGFDVIDPAPVLKQARLQAAKAEAALGTLEPPVTVRLAPHAPYSVSPVLFREIAAESSTGPLTVHLGESPEELEFLKTGAGPIREMLESLGVWTESWLVPECGPVEYLREVGALREGLLVVHAVQLRDDELEVLRETGATVVTCPRSNAWVGAGLPRVAHFYATGVPVAIGTDSLASAPTLNLFDELAELRRIAPDVSAASLLDSATRVGAEALGYGTGFGTLTPGKRAAFVAVSIPAGTSDVEEYLVSGVPADAVRPVRV